MISPSSLVADRYRVDARLGGGGMADVYDAYDEALQRPVALKLLRGIDDSDAARRFAEEIRLTARVNHPNIVSLFDAGEHDGSPYLVLERITGGTLAHEMAAGPMGSRRVAAMGEQVASALSHAHAAGIVHRDVKPTNILLTDDGSVRLADFGIAVTATATRLTVTGTIAGSAGYVSPEQVLGSGAGEASDVYALGLVLLECLTGAPPWSGTTVEVALARITADPVIPQDLPPGWVTLLTAMTAREPAERPPINLVGHALSRLAADEPYDHALFTPAPPPADRRIPAVAAMSLVVLLASAFMTLTTNVTPELAAADGSDGGVSANDMTSAALLSPANLPRMAPALKPAANRPEAPVADEAGGDEQRTAKAKAKAQKASAKTQADDTAAAPLDTGIDLPGVPTTATAPVETVKKVADDTVAKTKDTVKDTTDAVEDSTKTDETTKAAKDEAKQKADLRRSTRKDLDAEKTIKGLPGLDG